MKHVLICAAAALLVSCEPPAHEVAAARWRIDSAKKAEARAKEEKRERDFPEQLKRELGSFPFNGSEYHSTADGRTIEMGLFGFWARLINEGGGHANDSIRAIAAQLKKKVCDCQRKEFPLIRKGYFTEVKQLIAGDDIGMRLSGKGNTIITFTSPIFLSNTNTRLFYDKVRENLTTMRFKRVQFVWNGETTYYDLRSQEDGDLLNL